MEVVKKDKIKISKDNPSIDRISARCIDCGMCKNVCENVVGLDRTLEKDEILCINCGQCVMNCPVGALHPKYDYKTVLNLVKDSNKTVVISVAPAVRVSLGSEFGTPNVNMENVLPSILKAIGFDYVFDVTFGADVTIMEEASELVERLNKGGALPLFTSCCPAWVKYAKIFHPELLPNLSTAKSPIGMQSTLIKTYFKELNNIESDIISVVVAPCTAKKSEIINTDTDYVITTTELAMMIRECEIDVKNMKESSFDSMLGKGSKSGVMFGRSGGVMEAALNYAYYLLTNRVAPPKTFHIENKDGITKASYKLGGKTISVAVICGMIKLEEFLDEMYDYDFVEVMTCPGGCVGGGGNPLIPINKVSEERKTREENLNNEDADVLYCFQNPDIKDLYRGYLGKPLSQKSKKLLHVKH